ncbi:lipid A deacylase LpxR family protein [Vibrio japonicus]|uniref:Lipid A deacylase LpxR family protein n=1 Tax=Vibrio japonicus TaxID=1824638 RepID=A0ABY5LM33_9VIBR|nr:lipid A deacylase LpxR family protein [Vibrio japonicus]UUM31822.1 lipid A deacylase LpxR family protein [Vibrio japonicus]
MKANVALFVVLSLAPFFSQGSEHSTFSVTFDNDGLYSTDRDYTSGLFLTYTSRPFVSKGLLKTLSLSNWKGSSIDKLEFTLGHKIYTPEDLEANFPLVNDRPYAGYLHAEFNYISLHPQQAQRINVTIGTTGEHSFADASQDFVHKVTPAKKPDGWEYQIDNAIVGSVGYLAHFNLNRTQDSNNLEWELSNVSEANIGNFRSDVSTGFMVRWGSHLSDNLGAGNIDSEHPFRAGMLGFSESEWFFYTGVKGRYRFNDATIEGDRSGIEDNPNIPDPSIYDVELENIQAVGVAGFVIYNQGVGIALSTTIKTPDFKNAPRIAYGTGSLSLFAFF